VIHKSKIKNIVKNYVLYEFRLFSVVALFLAIIFLAFIPVYLYLATRTNIFGGDALCVLNNIPNRVSLLRVSYFFAIIFSLTALIKVRHLIKIFLIIWLLIDFPLFILASSHCWGSRFVY
jgi:hypothetical protein